MGRSSSPPPTPQIAPPPPPKEIRDFIDNVGRTKFVSTIDAATGKKVLVKDELPRRPEDQRLFDAAHTIVNNAIGEFQRLYNYDPNSVVSHAPFINTLNQINQERGDEMQRLMNIPDFTRYVDNFTQMGEDLLDREFSQSTRQLEADLGRLGYDRSTYGDELRADLVERRALAKAKLKGIEAPRYASELRREYLSQAGQEYGMNEMPRAARAETAALDYQGQLQRQSDLNQQQQQALAHQQALLGTGANILLNDQNVRMQSADSAAQLALGEVAQANSAQYAHYNAGVNAQTQQYRMDMDRYNNRPVGWGQQLFNSALGAAGQFGSGMAFGQPNTVAGGWGQRVLGPGNASERDMLRMGAQAAGTYYGGPAGGAIAGQIVGQRR